MVVLLKPRKRSKRPEDTELLDDFEERPKLEVFPDKTGMVEVEWL